MTCAHCGGSPAERTWDMRPCAIGENITYSLCDERDLELNGIVLLFFRVADREQRLSNYRQPASPA